MVASVHLMERERRLRALLKLLFVLKLNYWLWRGKLSSVQLGYPLLALSFRPVISHGHASPLLSSWLVAASCDFVIICSFVQSLERDSRSDLQVVSDSIRIDFFSNRGKLLSR